MNSKLFAILWVFLLLTGCRHSDSPQSSPLPNYTPPAWKEIERISSPDGSVDAVLATRFGPLLGDTDYGGDVTQHSLFLLRHGETVTDSQPYPSSDLDRFISKTREEAPFIGFDVGAIKFAWVSERCLEINVKFASEWSTVFQSATFWEVDLDDTVEAFLLDYEIDRNVDTATE